MLTDYIRAAMKQATYELLEDGTFYGEIPACPGVLTNADTLEDCREMLQDALEGWIILGLRLGHEMPVLEDNSLSIELKEVA
ncbi:type II toxin-antitoxin system HicB family antitoxin (plasmid) [Leptolyngbya sp. NK1-12]|uniref:Type II toxin-antitoxin system HicB family antitoxin n=1 Tax=Leptolyngbya sp. NK1-12 TaxID=2547451 RepID=A0AA96WMX8_9CYAN|nr:type II toxin-antitoxin system HicB family antitoxin [Leptolyngbya sp. NK1-12]